MLIAQGQNEVVNAREAAEILGIAERTIRRWIAAGLLPATKEGRSYGLRLHDARELRQRSRGVTAARGRDELLELRGRYAEMRDRVRELESQLADERRRSARLEQELDRDAA